MNIARNRNLDLVEVASNTNPPVCKLMNYSKYKYDMQKRLKHRKNRTIELKEVRFGVHLGENDYNVKIMKAREILSSGNILKVAIVFVGREIEYKELATPLIERIKNDLKDIANTIGNPELLGNRITINIWPK